MIVTELIAKMIQEGKILQIYEMIKSGTEGMQTLDRGLAHLVREKKIREVDGAQYAIDIHAYHRCVMGIESSSDRGWMSG